jgi:hypothetical protein
MWQLSEDGESSRVKFFIEIFRLISTDERVWTERTKATMISTAGVLRTRQDMGRHEPCSTTGFNLGLDEGKPGDNFKYRDTLPNPWASMSMVEPTLPVSSRLRLANPADLKVVRHPHDDHLLRSKISQVSEILPTIVSGGPLHPLTTPKISLCVMPFISNSGSNQCVPG